MGKASRDRNKQARYVFKGERGLEEQTFFNRFQQIDFGGVRLIL